MDELNLSEIRTFADAERLLDFVASARKLKDPGWFVRQLEQIGVERAALDEYLGSDVVAGLVRGRYASADDVPYGVLVKLIEVWTVLLQMELGDVIYHAEGLQRALRSFQDDWGSISEKIQMSISSDKAKAFEGGTP